ncbi:hypothetical protein CANARDRAFT_26533 [[Candida] arabinofermentans NRRL YB-2248]|uniref:Uncharacterized protein n=1 Tax=[Candida] arabinofermentans NRRL YB-2248 TaxID=983967 RepID=A0A1E4T5R2_9ASCO|nr:hypothetical protein CANARDRAFT_26533 [[Candida] arabinofermentans NRRL YB-2248]
MQNSTNLINLLSEYPNLNEPNVSLLKSYDLKITDLINAGFLTFNSNSTSNNNESNYKLNIPNTGTYLHILNKSSKYIHDTIHKQKQKTIIYNDLKGKFDNLRFLKFDGVNLDWVLSYLVGLGIVEVDYSPVGLILKLSGKKL